MGQPVDFGAQRKEAEESGLLGSGFFKLKEGENRLRLMSICLPHQSEFDGKKNFKWLCYIIDRTDGGLKIFFMPHKIYKAIEALQLNPDYIFAEVPMPYDIAITAKKAGTINVEYTLLPARRETPLTPAELDALEEAKPLAEIKQALDDKQQKAELKPVPSQQGQNLGALPSTAPPLTDEDIPF